MLDIIVPVLGRPHRVSPLMKNVAGTTKDYRLLFVVSTDDTQELEALQKAGADFLVVPSKRGSWACKINDGFKITNAPWVFTGADDLAFHPDWFERALRWVDDTIHVVGTNDICNHRVMSGQHSTHTLFRRKYVEEWGTIDQPGLVMHEGYKHDFTDDEAVATAKARGVYAHAYDSIVEHLHPLAGKAEDDDTYRKGRKHSSEGRRLFTKRKTLWADENVVRASMVPPPERAVVITATYGGYDCKIFAPVPQDMPVDFVCYTDKPDLQLPAPWRGIVRGGWFGDDSRMSAKVHKMLPGGDCDDVVWIDASHEITSPSFVREALASRHDGIAAFKHPRRDCAFKELEALLGVENQNGLYFDRPLKEQAKAYKAEGFPQRHGLYACGVVAWDLRDPRAVTLGEAWLAETERWSHQDQAELPVVCWRLGIKPGIFTVGQIDPKLGRGQAYLANRWFRIHPHYIEEAV